MEELSREILGEDVAETSLNPFKRASMSFSKFFIKQSIKGSLDIHKKGLSEKIIE